MVRKILLVLLGVLAVAAVFFYWYTRPLPILTVTTWPGAYGRAQASALMRPYAAAKRVDVRLAQWDGDLKDVASAVASHTYRGDVIDFELPKAVEACRRGLLEKLDLSRLPPGKDGTPAAKDFVAGALGPCWVGSVVYSQAIVYAPDKFAAAPKTLADFFDTGRFPGPRGLNGGSAKFNLELALLADGVAPGQVYATLATPAGLDRALRKLESLGRIAWWRNPDDAIAMVKDGRAVMASALNGEHGIYDARWPDVIWDRQLYELDVFGIPAGDPKKQRAEDFIAFATGSAPLARVSAWVPYGPARRSAWPLVGNNPELHIAMKPWLPTSHFATAFAVDDGWWRLHGAAIDARWRAWRAGQP